LKNSGTAGVVIDKAGNEETPQEVEIKIDKTAPEADISFNLGTQNLETQGKDNLGSVQVEQFANNEILLTDAAGNTTKLLMKSEEKKEEKETEKEEKKKNKIEIKGIIYNEGQLVALAENEFEVQFELDKKTTGVKKLKQDIEIEKQIEIEANYNSKKNETKIVFKKQKDKEQKEKIINLVILHLITTKGNLRVIY